MKSSPGNPEPAIGTATTGVLTRIRRALRLEAPGREEIRRRIRSKPGVIGSLSPEALEYIRNYDGLENMGPPPDEPKPGLLTRMVEWLADDAPSPRWAPSEHKRGGLARVMEWLVDDAPTEEEARRRLRSKPGFFSTLSPEARAAVLSYDGPESLGRPDCRR